MKKLNKGFYFCEYQMNYEIQLRRNDEFSNLENYIQDENSFFSYWLTAAFQDIRNIFVKTNFPNISVKHKIKENKLQNLGL